MGRNSVSAALTAIASEVTFSGGIGTHLAASLSIALATPFI